MTSISEIRRRLTARGFWVNGTNTREGRRYSVTDDRAATIAVVLWYVDRETFRAWATAQLEG